jgi:hypothetical protein
MALTKHGFVLHGGTEPYEEPYNRVQIFGTCFKHVDKWRMFYIYQYGDDGVNRLFNAAYAESDSAFGPFRKTQNSVFQGIPCSRIISDVASWGVYFDQYVGRYRGAGIYYFGESVNPVRWATLLPFSSAPNDTSTSLIRHQPLSPNNGKPFIATVRAAGTWANGTLRRIGWHESGDFVTWSSKAVISQFDSPDGGWTQPYALQLTSYGDKIVGLLWWLHLDPTISGNNKYGTLDAELVWLNVPANATSIAGLTWNRTNTPFIACDTAYIHYTAQSGIHGVPPGPNECQIALATMPKSELDTLIA